MFVSAEAIELGDGPEFYLNQAVNFQSRNWSNLTQRMAGYWKSFREHTDLLTSFALLAINVAFFAGKLFTSLPPAVAAFSYTALNFIGLLSLNFQFSLMRKTCRDAQLCHQAKERKYLAMTVTQVGYIASGILFTLGGASAAVLQDLDDQEDANMLYDWMRTPGMIAIGVGIGLDISYFLAYRQTARQLQLLRREGEEVEQSSCLHVIRHSQAGINLSSEAELALAARVRTCMDKYTLELLIKRLNDEANSSNQCLEVIDENLQTQLKVEKFLLVLRALGWGGMAISRLYPYSLAQASIDLGMSGLYTGRLCWKKWEQAKQRKSLSSTPQTDADTQLELLELAVD